VRRLAHLHAPEVDGFPGEQLRDVAPTAAETWTADETVE